MTNEALVTLIQQGRSDLVPVLWFQVERFIAQQANHWTLANRSRVEFDDLYQAGFLAVMEAVRTFDGERGVKFVTWLGYPLHKAFQDVLGIRTERQRRDPLRNAVSLDAPVQEDEMPLRDDQSANCGSGGGEAQHGAGAGIKGIAAPGAGEKCSAAP